MGKIKDAVLQTVSEMDKSGEFEKISNQEPFNIVQKRSVDKSSVPINKEVLDEVSSDNELDFLLNLKERILVLFEGFSLGQNDSMDAKINISLNFFEYLLSVLEDRIDNIQK